MAEEVPGSFQAAATGLRAKRRALSKELLEFLKVSKPDNLPTIEVFREKQAQFEKQWDDVVKANNNCVSLLNTGEEQDTKKIEEINDALEDVRDRKERLTYLEEEIMSKAAGSTNLKDAVLDESNSALDDKSISAIEPGNETDFVEKVDSPASVQMPDAAEGSVESSVTRKVKSEKDPSVELRVDKGGILDAIQKMNKTMGANMSVMDENIHHLKDNMNENIHYLNDNMNENMNALEQSMNTSLDRCVSQLSKDITTMQGSIGDIRSDVIDLKSENIEIKKELESSSYKSDKKIKDLQKSLMKCIDDVNDRVVRVEHTVTKVPSVNSHVSESVENKPEGLKQVNSRNTEASSMSSPVFNDADVTTPKSMVAPGNTSPSVLDDASIAAASSSDNLSTGDSIARALAQQTRFNTAMALGRSPSMFFQGELYKYVQFVTMFRGTFDKTIADPVSLFEILLRHTKGPAKAAIESCVFSAPHINRYEEAMSILKHRYGQKNGVIRSHRERLLAGKTLVDSIADFEILSNELKGYCSVLEHYEVDLQYYSCEVVKDIVSRRMSKRSGAEFSKLIQRKGLMDQTASYLPKLCEWVDEKIIFWQSELGCSLVHGFKPNSTKSFSISVEREQPEKNVNSGLKRTTFSKAGFNDNKTTCIFCEKSGHSSLFDCTDFKNSDMTVRCRFVRDKYLCWRCLKHGHIARFCARRDIKSCDKYRHCEVACPCDYAGRKFISGVVSVNRSLSNRCEKRAGVRLPILPVNVYTPRGYKRVYALLDTGSEECLVSRELYSELGLKGVPLEVLLITADGKRSVVSSIDTSFSIGPIDQVHTKFEINNALVLNEMPPIGKNFPTSENLDCFDNAYDFIRNGKFTILSDEKLHINIGVRAASLLNYD